MEKLLTTLSVCLLTTASVLAQGRINFVNSSATAIRIWHNSINNGNPVILGTASTAQFGIGPASVRIQLLAGLTSSSLSPVLIGTGANQLYVTNTASGIASAQGTFAGGSNLALAGYDGSAPVFLQMTLQSLNGAYTGFSPIIQVNLATGVATATPVFSPTFAPNTWGPNSNNEGLWTGNIGIGPWIPEPSAMALVGLSFSVMFFARRRK